MKHCLHWGLFWMLSVLSSVSTLAQQSSNTVKYKVTYDATTQTYTAWVVPDYATPNTNNVGASELASTAQFTLKVPIGFVISNITDASGTQVWDKNPAKLGQGLSLTAVNGTVFTQDYSPAVLDPAYGYYVVGKAPTESNLGAFAVGVPVALFTFKGNGCFGPISPLAPGDPFIQASFDAFSFNVANSFYSSSGQPAGGNQDPLEQFINITGSAASCYQVPVAIGDIATTRPGQSVPGNVLTNDVDPQGLPLTVTTTPACQPAHGTVVLSADGSYTYTPTSGYTGTDSFCYQVCSSAGLCSTATVGVNVVPDPNPAVNNQPVPNNDNTLTKQGVPVTVAVLANDTDPDSVTSLNGQLNNPTIVAQPSVGTAVVNANGTVTYTPPANFTGVVTFPYQVCDKASTPLCATALVTVNVQPTPPVGTTLSPVAVDDALLTQVGIPKTGSLATNDSDPNSPALPLTYTAGTFTTPHGTVVVSPTGSYTYTPTTGYSGPDSFTYTVCNSAGLCDKATLTMTVLTPACSLAVPSSISVSPSSVVCLSSGAITLTTSGSAGASFSWSVLPSSGAGLGSSASNSITMTPTAAGSYTVSATQSLSGCTSPAITTVVTVNSAPATPTAGSISSINPSSCGGSNGSISLSGYSASTSYIVSYSQNGNPATVTLISNASGVLSLSGLSAGSYTQWSVQQAATSCSSGTYAGPITLSAPAAPVAPGAISVSSSSVVCLGSGAVTLTTSGTTGASFTWAVLPSSGAGLGSSTSNSVSMTPTAVGSYTVSVTQTVAGCMSPATTTVVTVNPVPATPTVANINSTNPTACGGSDGTITLSGYTANTSYVVNYSKNGTPASATLTSNGSGAITLSSLSAGSYTQWSIQQTTTSCSSGTYAGAVTITTPVAPSAPGAISVSPSPICLGTGAATLTTSGTTGASFTWSVLPSSGAGLGSSTSNSISMTPTVAGSYTVSVTQTVGGCISPATTTVVTVNGITSAPTVSASTLNATCPQTSVNLTGLVSTTLAGTSVVWFTNASHTGTAYGTPAQAGNGIYYAFYYNATTGCYGPASSPVTVTITACLPCAAVNPGIALASVASTTTGGVASFSVIGASPGATTTWTISPAGGVSPSSGTGTLTGPIVFSIAGNYEILFTTTNNNQPAGCTTPNIATSNVVFLVENPLGPCAKPSSSSAIVNPSSAAIFAGGTASFTMVGGTPSTAVQWAVIPSTGVTPNAGVGTTTGNLTFANEGLYSVVFNIVNYGNGDCLPVQQSSSTQIAVGLNPCFPPTNFVITSTATANKSTLGQTVQFTALGGIPGNVTWQITPATGASPSSGTGNVATVTFSQLGTYGITFISDNSSLPLGCTKAIKTTETVMHTVAALPPVAVNDINQTLVNVPTSGNVLTNDSDPQGLSLTASTSPVVSPTHGTVTISPTGTYTYTPANSFTGTDSFTYQVCNSVGQCTTAVATIEVRTNSSLVNDPPLAQNDQTTVKPGSSVTIPVLSNDSDPEGQPLTTPTVVGQPKNGIAIVNPNGTITYTPTTGFTGVDSFTYSVCDTGTPPACDTAVVTINVQPDPTGNQVYAYDDANSTQLNTPVSGNVLTNDVDPEGNSLTANPTPVTAPAHGTVIISSTGSYTYTPATGYSGPDRFLYKVCDSGSPTACDTATVYLTVFPSNVVTLLPKVYLQGALFGVNLPDLLMRDDLRSKGYLPNTSPYASWGAITPTGTMAASVTAVTGADAIVDWVFVELRSPSNFSLVVDSRAALVQRDGDIVDIDGVSSLTFASATPASYYVAVRHRNHLGVMSASVLALSNTPTVVDFRQASTPTYRITTTAINQAQVTVAQGVAMWAGNVLYDKSVIYQGTTNDVSAISQQVKGATSNITASASYILNGYSIADVNMDGRAIYQGTGNDVNYIYQNVTKNHPGNTSAQNFFIIKEQLP